MNAPRWWSGMRVSQRRWLTALAILLACLFALGVAHASVTVQLSSCSRWSINDGVFVCDQATAPTVTVTPPVVTPPVAVGGCGGYQVLTLPVAWPRSGTSSPRAKSGDVGAFGNGTVLVVPFHTGTKAGIGRVSVSEFGSGPTMRTVSLAAVPCGFGASALTTRQGNGVSLYFSVGPNGYGYPALEANHDYYFNVKNEQDGQGTCVSGSCDVGLDILAP